MRSPWRAVDDYLHKYLAGTGAVVRGAEITPEKLENPARPTADLTGLMRRSFECELEGSAEAPATSNP